MREIKFRAWDKVDKSMIYLKKGEVCFDELNEDGDLVKENGN